MVVNVSTSNVEMKLNGCGPWSLSDDVQLIHTPGHTEGSVCLFYKPLKVLFTGDHLALASDESNLAISEIYNFYSGI
ncbi:putative metallo-beta-lactamase, ribonuclease Z/Hydroxyacylglutathione hydrolase [Helianthus debilis subsp. tardiflorus]